MIRDGVPVLGNRYGFIPPSQRRLKPKIVFSVDAGLL